MNRTYLENLSKYAYENSGTSTKSWSRLSHEDKWEYMEFIRKALDAHQRGTGDCEMDKIYRIGPGYQ